MLVLMCRYEPLRPASVSVVVHGLLICWLWWVIDKKVTPKRRRSSAAGDVSPPVSGSSSGSTATGAGGSAVKSKPPTSGCQTPRMTVPLSERQQLALLMQMTAEEQPTPGQPVSLLLIYLFTGPCRHRSSPIRIIEIFEN